MTTYYKRSIRRRFYSWIDELKWNRSNVWFWFEVAFCVIVTFIVTEIVWSV